MALYPTGVKVLVGWISFGQLFKVNAFAKSDNEGIALVKGFLDWEI
jgi:hypothetical protein